METIKQMLSLIKNKSIENGVKKLLSPRFEPPMARM